MIRDRKVKLKREQIKKILQKILNDLDFSLPRHQRAPSHIDTVELVFVSDLEISRLNQIYRRKTGPTDVLSFSNLDSNSPAPFSSLGELIVSISTAKRYAPLFGNDLSRELLRLLVHGVLHLHGFDHEDVPYSAVRRMRRWEDKLFLRYSRVALAICPNAIP